jgi:hypothetical protein
MPAITFLLDQPIHNQASDKRQSHLQALHTLAGYSALACHENVNELMSLRVGYGAARSFSDGAADDTLNGTPVLCCLRGTWE